MTFLQKLEVDAATWVLDYVKTHSAEIEKELAPYVAAGEKDIVALADKVNPILGAAVAIAVKYLGKDLPAYESDAVAWIEATLQAFITKVEAS